MEIRTTSGRGRLYDSVLDTVGNTPCIRINKIAPANVTVYVKFEAFNPAGSVKDRLALNIIEAGEREGRLKPGQTVVEATSGNTGSTISLIPADSGRSFSSARGIWDILYSRRLMPKWVCIFVTIATSRKEQEHWD